MTFESFTEGDSATAQAREAERSLAVARMPVIVQIDPAESECLEIRFAERPSRVLVLRHGMAYPEGGKVVYSEPIDSGDDSDLPVAGRFVLLSDPEGGYCTSWDTWEEAAVAFDETRGDRIPPGFQLLDQETGRVWREGDGR